MAPGSPPARRHNAMARSMPRGRRTLRSSLRRRRRTRGSHPRRPGPPRAPSHRAGRGRGHARGPRPRRRPSTSRGSWSGLRSASASGRRAACVPTSASARRTKRGADLTRVRMALRQLLDDVEQAEQCPTLAPTPAVPVGLPGALEEEMREEAVRLLEQADRRERLVSARIDEPLVPGEAAELHEERRVEVQAVDERSGAGVFEERLLGRRQRSHHRRESSMARAQTTRKRPGACACR